MIVYLIDGTYELFRAYFGAPTSQNREGREIGAARAFARSMAGFLRDAQVTHVAIAFDTVIESFRNELFAGYKTGEGMDPVLYAQFPLAEEAARALGIVTWPMIEMEADDALSTAAFRFAQDPRVSEIRICSPDKDLCQCVNERVVVYDRKKATRTDRDGVKERLGVWPAQVPAFLALVGDTADGIPGVPRWGEKSAAAVLARYARIEDIPDDATSWEVRVRGAAQLAASLREARAHVGLYETLARLRLDAPIAESLDDLAYRGPDRARLEALRETLSDANLARDLERA